MSEQDIVRAILNALRLQGARAWRQQSGVIPKGGRYIHTGEKGLPDIGCIVPPRGRYLGLEVKTKTGKVSEDQVKWAEEAAVFGARVAVVRSAQEAVDAYLSMRAEG